MFLFVCPWGDHAVLEGVSLFQHGISTWQKEEEEMEKEDEGEEEEEYGSFEDEGEEAPKATIVAEGKKQKKSVDIKLLKQKRKQTEEEEIETLERLVEEEAPPRGVSFCSPLVDFASDKPIGIFRQREERER